jgi:hypothetical protein
MAKNVSIFGEECGDGYLNFLTLQNIGLHDCITLGWASYYLLIYLFAGSIFEFVIDLPWQNMLLLCVSR